MRKILTLIITAVLCIGCFKPADRMEIAEIRKADPEQRNVMPLLGTTARMGLADANGTIAAPHGEMPPSMLQDVSMPPVLDMPLLDATRLAWQPPDGWQRGEEHPMRLATYMPANTQKTECAVTLLTGMAGGVAANLNRWRAQFGRELLSDDEMAALPRWDMLDTQATYLACADIAGANMLYGVICPVPGGLLFVKMTGPLHEMKPEQERFKEFCLSMKIKDEA